MPQNVVCKTVHQYSKGRILKEDMDKLQEIAGDCHKVKNYVYGRYGGPGSLEKIYPGYTVQKEMAGTGLREQLGLPSVYFNLAVLDALGDIRGQWVRTKGVVLQRVNRNEGFSEDEKHFLRFVLKVNNIFSAVLNRKVLCAAVKEGADSSGISGLKEPACGTADTAGTSSGVAEAAGRKRASDGKPAEGMAPEPAGKKTAGRKAGNAADTVELRADIWRQYGKLSGCVDVKRLENYLCRQVRKLHVKPHTEKADGFSLTERAYRYGEHGIYITVKERRKRIFVPLTDNNRYVRQIYVRLYPEKESLEILAPVDVEVRRHEDYTNRVGIALGMHTMFTTDKGHVYGEKLGELGNEYAGWLREQAVKHAADGGRNPGRTKYEAKKSRMRERLYSYINMEINRFLREEMPEVVFIPKLPRPRKRDGSKEINHSVNMWQRGYIRKRLEQKCREQSVGITEVFGKGISSECSMCGGAGGKRDGMFYCRECGYGAGEKENAARNVLGRGMARMGTEAGLMDGEAWQGEGI